MSERNDNAVMEALRTAPDGMDATEVFALTMKTISPRFALTFNALLRLERAGKVTVERQNGSHIRIYKLATP